MSETNIFPIKSFFSLSSLSATLIQICRAKLCDVFISNVHARLPSIYRSYAVVLRTDSDNATINPRTVSSVGLIETVEKETHEHRLVELL